MKIPSPASLLAQPLLSRPLTGGDRVVPHTLDVKGSQAAMGQVSKTFGGRTPSPKSSALKGTAASPSSGVIYGQFLHLPPQVLAQPRRLTQTRVDL